MTNKSSIYTRILNKVGIKPKKEFTLDLKITYITMSKCAWCDKESSIYWEQRFDTNIPGFTIKGLSLCTTCAEDEKSAKDLIEFIMRNETGEKNI